MGRGAPAHHRQLGSNGSFYLYEGCEPDLQVCVVGADLDAGQGPETITFFNESADETLSYIAVLDADEPLSGGLYFFDVTRTEIPEPDMGNTCVEAAQLPNFQSGQYYQGDMLDFTDEVNPGFNGCTGSSTTGPDGMVPLLVPDNATLEVTVSMPDADPVLYLLGQCNNPGTCITGSDDVGSIETLVYQNTSGANQQLTLVIDTTDPVGSAFNLTVNVF